MTHVFHNSLTRSNLGYTSCFIKVNLYGNGGETTVTLVKIYFLGVSKGGFDNSGEDDSNPP